MPGAVSVRGLRELPAAFAAAGKDARKELRDGLRGVAEPIRRDAEALATSEIRNIGAKWPLMRIGVTRKVIYVAPKQRGVKSRGRGAVRRPNLANLLADRALEPALERNRHGIEAAVEHMLDSLGRTWERY